MTRSPVINPSHSQKIKVDQGYEGPIIAPSGVNSGEGLRGLCFVCLVFFRAPSWCDISLFASASVVGTTLNIFFGDASMRSPCRPWNWTDLAECISTFLSSNLCKNNRPKKVVLCALCPVAMAISTPLFDALVGIPRRPRSRNDALPRDTNGLPKPV